MAMRRPKAQQLLFQHCLSAWQQGAVKAAPSRALHAVPSRAAAPPAGPATSTSTQPPCSGWRQPHPSTHATGSLGPACASAVRQMGSSVAAAVPETGGGRGGVSMGFAASDASTSADDEDQSQLTPAAVVERLDRFIVGQADAKKAVAIAYRNRWRRHRVPPELKDEIVPKNILMIGPTGCGKTEIARRLAKLADAPFVKLEATKFTEVGYHGRDVDSIVRDLLENAILLVRTRLKKQAARKIAEAVEKRVLAALSGNAAAADVEKLRQQYRDGKLEDALIEVELPSPKGSGEGNGFTMQGGVVSLNLDRMFSGRNASKERRRMRVSEARPYLEEAEAEQMFPAEAINAEAIRAAQEDGIVFIDEIDKIVNSRGSFRHGSDPSNEGVQRDLLPIIEGSTVSTKHGNVSTDHVLFICSGAFHSCKPSDMLAELQGRLPIRVELQQLTQEDFYRILTEPQYNMIQQQKMLLQAEGVDLHFTDAAVHEIARVAEQINREVENIGARRLHTVLERIVEDISFQAPDWVEEARSNGQEGNISHTIDKEDVVKGVGDLLKAQDLAKFIL